MKKLLSFFVGVLLSISLYSQSGGTCTLAKTFLPDTLGAPEMEQHSTDKAWYQFVSKNSSLDLTILEMFANTSNKLLSAKLWSGSLSEESSIYNDFKLFPNPNDGTMNFIYSLKEASKGVMVIYDLTGKAVANYQLASGLDNQILINETNLSNGVYFYKVIIDNEIKVSDKIVIIK